VYTSIDDCKSLQKNITNVSIWNTATNLLLYEAKFVHLCFLQNFYSAPVSYKFNDKSITGKKQHKDLVHGRLKQVRALHTTKAYITLGLLLHVFKANAVEAM